MRRFFVERIEEKDSRIRVAGAEARHMTRVLRMGPGDRLALMDGSGARVQAVIRSAGKDGVLLDVERTLKAPPPSPVAITLCASLIKSRPMDLLIQKASELGVDRIQPFASSRTVVRLPEKRKDGRLRHWQEIARNAAKQADRSVPARVEDPVTFEALLEAWRGSGVPLLLLWEGEETRDLQEVLRGTPSAPALAVVVGPEGGFSESEVAAARTAGFQPVSLGRRILRAETAALTVTALIQYEWGDLSLAPAHPSGSGT